MPVPTTIDQLSTTAASNYPQGTDSPSTLDDTQRAHGAFIRQLQTGAVATTANVTAGAINGATVGATTPSTGAFTTLGASGSTTLTGTSLGINATDGTNSAWFANASANNAYANGTVTGNAVIRGTTGVAISGNAGTGVQALVTSTGLSVTGALSASGPLTVTNVSNPYLKLNDGTNNAYVQLTSGKLNLSNPSDITLSPSGGSVTSTFTNTGLSVTGALSATGDISSSSDTVIYSTNGGAGTRSGIQLLGSNQTMRFYTASTLQATLDTSGNLGLGAASFGYKFEATSAGNQYRLFNTGANAERYGISVTASGTAFTSINTAGTSLPYVWSGSAEYMRLDASGRLLVHNGTVVAPVAFASLPASPVAGQRAMINNSVAAPAFLSTAAGGGSTTVPVFYNGTTWLVG